WRRPGTPTAATWTRAGPARRPHRARGRGPGPGRRRPQQPGDRRGAGAELQDGGPHLSNIFARLGVAPRPQAAAYAFEHGLATPSHGEDDPSPSLRLGRLADAGPPRPT